MRDQYSDARVGALHPAVRQQFTDFINDAETQLDVTLRVMLGFRTFDQQDALYQQGRTHPGNIVTNAPAGKSFHNYGLAVDLCHINDDGSVDWNFDMAQLEPIATAHNLEWGGCWTTIKDKPHFEARAVNGVTYSENCSELLAKYNAREVDANGYLTTI